jgi:chemotaxis protein MotB
MRRNGNNNKPQELRGRWLLTFNDMMTLLFAFFVLIISMSSLDSAKVKGVAASARKVIDAAEVPKGAKIKVIEPVLRSAERDQVQASAQFIPGGLEDRKKALRQSLLLVEGVTVSPRKDGLTVMMGEPLLFTPGSVELIGAGQQVLKSLGLILQRTDVEIRVEGHTDELPPTPGKYPSNWELSLARAVNTVQYLAAQGGVVPERLSAAGYADTKPKAANVNNLNRQMNRRVEVILRFAEN